MRAFTPHQFTHPHNITRRPLDSPVSASRFPLWSSPVQGASQFLCMEYAAPDGAGLIWHFTTNRSRLRRWEDGANPPSNVPAGPARGGIFVENHRKRVKAPSGATSSTMTLQKLRCAPRFRTGEIWVDKD